MDTTGGNVSIGPPIFLRGGDANDDNFSDTTDFGLLVGCYGTSASVPGSGYDSNCDFNCDGFVDTTDFGILVGNYAAEGSDYAGVLMAVVNGSEIDLAWQGSAQVASGYHLYRSIRSGDYSNATLISTGFAAAGSAITFHDPIANFPNPNTAVYYIVKAYNANGEYAASNEVEVDGWSLYHINCGGGASGIFTADAYYTGGNAVSTTAIPDTTTVSNPAPSAVYQTARATDLVNPRFSYTMPNLTAGSQYLVRLHLIDPDSTEVFQRQFNITINGTLAESDFDIFGWLGGKGRVVNADYITTADANGKIEIDFDATRGIAICSGIEVMTAGTPAPTNVEGYATDTNKITLYWDAMPGATGYNIYRGIAEGGEDMLHPINGATPVNDLSFQNSSTAVYNDMTNVVNGTDYYYVVKAIYPNGISVASSEGIALASASGIPWDSRDSGRILDAIYNVISNNLTDSDPLTEFVALGPDGSVYDQNAGTMDSYGQFNGSTAEFQTTDGTLVRIPGDTGSPDLYSARLFHPLTQNNTSNMPGANGPQRRIATTFGFDAIRGDFQLTKPVVNDKIWTTNQFLANANPTKYLWTGGNPNLDQRDGQYIMDTPEVHLGSHLDYGAGKSEAEGVLSFGPNGWGLYLAVDGVQYHLKHENANLKIGDKNKEQPRPKVAGIRNLADRFNTGEEVNMTFWTRYPDNPTLCSIEAFNVLNRDVGAPHMAVVGPRRYAAKYDQYTVLKRVQAIAQKFGAAAKPLVVGTGFIIRTGSSWTGCRWGNSNYTGEDNNGSFGPGQVKVIHGAWTLQNANNTYNQSHPATITGFFLNDPVYYDVGFVGRDPSNPDATVSWMGEYVEPGRSTGYAFEDQINISILPH